MSTTEKVNMSIAPKSPEAFIEELSEQQKETFKTMPVLDCGKCIFSDFDADKNTSSCSLGRYEKILNSPHYAVIDTFNDDGTNNKLVVGRCGFFSDKEAVEEQGLSRFECEQNIREQNSFRYSVIVNYHGSLDELKKVIAYFKNTTVKPQEMFIFFDYQYRKVSPEQIQPLLEDCPFEYRVTQTIVKPKFINDAKRTTHTDTEVISKFIGKVNSFLTFYLPSDYCPHEQFCDTLNNVMREDLYVFAAMGTNIHINQDGTLNYVCGPLLIPTALRSVAFRARPHEVVLFQNFEKEFIK